MADGPTTESGIRERSPGSYEIRAYNKDTGRQEYASYISPRREWGAGIRTARTRHAQLIADIADGKYGGSKGTLSNLVKEYIDHREKTGKSPTTIRAYRSMARSIDTGPGKRRLARLTAHDLDSWYADLLEQGMTPATVHHRHRLILAALTQGERWGWVNKNVGRLAAGPTVQKQTMVVPPPDRVVALIRHAEKSRAKDMESVIVLAALTGLRRGELCGLRWVDVDWTGKHLTVDRSVWQGGKEWGVKPPKTHQSRVVTVGVVALTALQKWRGVVEARSRQTKMGMVEDAYVFSPEPDGAIPKMPDVISHRFRLFCQALQDALESKTEEDEGRKLTEAEKWPYRFHDLRHYQATELIAAGLPMVTVSRRLGHAKVSTTSDIYAHDTDDNALLAASAIDSGLAVLTKESAMTDTESIKGTPR